LKVLDAPDHKLVEHY